MAHEAQLGSLSAQQIMFTQIGGAALLRMQPDLPRALTGDEYVLMWRLYVFPHLVIRSLVDFG